MSKLVDPSSRIFVAGHRGLVGSAIVRRLQAEGFTNILTVDRSGLDLRSQADVLDYLRRERPEFVVLAAAKVGGIHANSTYPAEFIHDNLAIQTNVIHGAWMAGVGKLLFLGSSCIYPVHSPQPIREESLLTGPLEPSNEWYAIAKIAGLKMCSAYRQQYCFDAISAMPTNLYGPGDNYHPENSHVIPALVRRFTEAARDAQPSVTIWGTGQPLREFMHADDMASACVFLMKHYSGPEPINIGTGAEVSIAGLARLIARLCGYGGEIVFDASRPDGAPRKLLDSSRIAALGWKPSFTLETGLTQTIAAYRAAAPLPAALSAGAEPAPPQ